MRNNRIEEACRSNQGCANYWLLKSKLRCDTLKIFFQQHRSTAVFKRCLRHVRYHPNNGAKDRVIGRWLWIALARDNALAIGADHTFLIFLGDGFFPVNVLAAVRRCRRSAASIARPPIRHRRSSCKRNLAAACSEWWMALRRWLSKPTPTLCGGRACGERSATSCSGWTKPKSTGLHGQHRRRNGPWCSEPLPHADPCPGPFIVIRRPGLDIWARSPAPLRLRAQRHGTGDRDHAGYHHHRAYGR